MSEPTAWVRFHEAFPAAPILAVHEYQAPDPAYPTGRVLIEGRGKCPLWADLSQIEVSR